MECLNCGKILTKTQKKYCSKQCQCDYQYLDFIEKWKRGLDNGIRGQYGISAHIRRYLFEKYNSKCSRCGWGEVNSHTGKIPLEIEHIDGDYTNNKEENLDLICPNCHSLTSTYKGANKGFGRKCRDKYSLYKKKKNFCINCGKEISLSAKRCVQCDHENKRIIPLPDRDFLKEQIRTLTFVDVGKKYGVVDNTIRKWCKKLSLPTTKREIKSYSDEEWLDV